MTASAAIGSATTTVRFTATSNIPLDPERGFAERKRSFRYLTPGSISAKISYRFGSRRAKNENGQAKAPRSSYGRGVALHDLSESDHVGADPRQAQQHVQRVSPGE